MAVADKALGNAIIKAGAVGIGSFAVLGTVSALWSNPLFVRMTPAGGWEIILLALTSLLAGIYVVIRRPQCSARSAAGGGILAFLGVACPTCNKLLMLLFGGEFLLAYFEPIRLWVAAAGALVLLAAVVREQILSPRRSERGGTMEPRNLIDDAAVERRSGAGGHG